MDHGLRQGIIYPFLFLIVVEGFSLFMKKTVDIGELLGLRFEVEGY